MSYPGLISEPYELREREHQDYHTAEHIFDKKCVFCMAEMCRDCDGFGMTKDCKDICARCNGRGRII